MVVQVNQSRYDERVTGIDHGRIRESGRSRAIAGDHRIHETVVAEINATRKYGRRFRRAHGNDTTSDHQRHVSAFLVTLTAVAEKVYREFAVVSKSFAYLHRNCYPQP